MLNVRLRRSVLLGLALLTPLHAAAQAGRLILAAGEVAIVRGGQAAPASMGAAVQTGDTIRVGPSSNAQIRFSDESIVALRPQTVFSIDEYVFSGSADGSEKGLFSLVKGGMRTVTGLIGRLPRLDSYAVRTPTSTVGIRGTHYTLVHCDNDCAAPGQAAAGAQLAAATTLAQSDAGKPGLGTAIANGTYGGVTDGRIGVKNQVAEREFGHDEYFYVASSNTPPVSLIAPPPFLHDRLESQARSRGKKPAESGEGVAQSGGASADGRANATLAPTARSEFVVTEEKKTDGTATVLPSKATHGYLGAWISAKGDGGAGGVFGSSLNFFTGSPPDSVTLKISEGCTGPTGDNCPSGVTGTLSGLQQSGCSGDVCWGRWASGTLTESDGTVNNPMGGFHGLVGPLTAPETIASKTGTFSFQSVNGTTPTNNLGQVASSATYPELSINFTTRTGMTSSSGTWAFASQTWTIPSSIPVSLTVVAGQGAYIRANSNSVVTCSGSCNPNGKFEMGGIFMGPTGSQLGTSMSVSTQTPGTQASAQAVRLYQCSGC